MARYDVVKPSIDAAVNTLSHYVTQHTAALLDRTNPADLSDAQLDDLIIELCDSGNRMDAIKLLKRHRDYSTLSAKQFVDELTGDVAVV